jgi:hypothetical protein
MTEEQNDRRNELIDKMYCAEIFGKVNLEKKVFEFDPDFPWTKEMADELKILDAMFEKRLQ